MGRAGKALRQVLQTYGISQNKLAVALKVRPSVVFRWFHEQVDPNGETIVEIVLALKAMNPDAAEAFIRSYLGELMQEDEL
ncbi:XRE family transcriptional regulator [filamentous cyanobacterium CCP1]|nr:XRE family transcriptional regulator [filamentous cyanobacterium CCP2]PSB58377.1 XRE family transcriptional regulator [filamentous cyanobacterium CCP1]